MCACAVMLLALPATAASQSEARLGAQLTRHLSTMKKDQQVLRFLEKHSWLKKDPRFAAEAKRQVRVHTASLRQAKRKAAVARAVLARKAKERQLAAVAAASPKQVICRVFGDHCGEALAVSRCESRFQTDAQNGQYLGLFQMGSSERRIFGHGSSPVAQATAAHKYFVASGRDWSPWSCKPWN